MITMKSLFSVLPSSSSDIFVACLTTLSVT
jgi:hypothetical protein